MQKELQQKMKQSQLLCSGHFLAIDSCRGQRNLFLHMITQKVYEAAILKINYRYYQRTYQLAKWRKYTQYPIVQINHFKIQRQVRDGSYLTVFFENCPFLLADFVQITLLQALYIFKTTILAMEKLIQKFGYFCITDKMIGINRVNLCKIWINQKFQQHQKQLQCRSQQEMIKILICILENKTIKDQKSQKFFKKSKQIAINFPRAHDYLSLFLFQESLVVPPFFFAGNKNNQSNNRKEIMLELHKRSVSMYNLRKIQKRNLKSGSFFQVKSGIFHCLKGLTNKKKQKRVNIRQKMKSSKQTATQSSQVRTKKSLQTDTQRPSNKMKISFTNNNVNSSNSQASNDKIIQDQNKKMIMSTLNAVIASDHSFQNSQNIYHCKLSEIQQKQSRAKSLTNSINLKSLLKQNLEKNHWTQKISQLFTGDTNLNESLNIGEEEKLYIKDFKLNKLGEFGRLISHSLLQLDQEEEDQHSVQPMSLLR